MIRFCENRTSSTEYESSPEKCLIMDETIWQRGREYFTEHDKIEILPVLDRNNQFICYAWQDEEANREIRMLRELSEQRDALSFRDLHMDCVSVTIHGCNELAWYMREYLIKNEILVYVEGRFWEELGIQEEKCDVPKYQNYEIWAEGVHQKSGDWKQERLRSASAEFECIDEIYEANIKAGKITDCDTDVEELLERLRKEKEIVIRGTGTKAQDAYEWLLMNNVTVCAFQSESDQNGRKRLLGRPVKKGAEIKEQFKKAIIIECVAKHSSWGFGEVDTYDYEGYERNKRYFLLRDYIETPENNLMYVFKKKKLILTGDIRLCNRVFKWCRQYGVEHERICYWDVLGDNEIRKFQIPVIRRETAEEENTVMLVLPEYSFESYMTKEAVGKKNIYITKFKEYGIADWSDYFSDMMKCIHLETETSKLNKKELCPAGILLGAIPGSSGNVLVRQMLAGHPQIILIEEYSALNNELYYICIRLAEENAKDILDAFWELYHAEMKEDRYSAFFDKDTEKFNKKMEELLTIGESFSSQELFVMIHLSYIAMYGGDVSNLKETIIYWEPHMWDREYVREWAYWLGCDNVKNFTLNVARNTYVRAGSFLRYNRKLDWEDKKFVHILWKYEKTGTVLKNGYEYTIKFEELKCNPKELLIKFCEWLDIKFDDSLMETTLHGKKAFYDGVITGFDPRPAYNLYEEFFSGFDRMRICIINCSYQKKYGYPYVRSKNFSRRELQEMFLRDFRWEQSLHEKKGRNRELIWEVQKCTRRRLWLERFAEVMEVEIDEEY